MKSFRIALRKAKLSGWPSGKAADCNSAIGGSIPPPDSNLTIITMSRNYNPYEDYDEIIPKDVQQSLNKDHGNVVYGDSMSDEEFAETGSVIVYLFVTLFLMAIAVIIYLLTY